MFIEWRQNLSVGIGLIDEEHEKIVDFLNKLHEALETGASETVLSGALTSVMAYTVYHFNHEESLFLPTDYPDKEAHIAEHCRITEHLTRLQSRLRYGQSERLVVELSTLLKDWLMQHIQSMDMGYPSYIQSETT